MAIVMNLQSNTMVQAITISSTATEEDILKLGKTYLEPRNRAMYADFRPQTIDEWQAVIYSLTFRPWFWYVGPHLGGSHWLHDSGEDTQGVFAWVGGLVMPEFRGPSNLELRREVWRLAYADMKAQGYCRLMGAVLADNFPAQKWTEECCGWTRVGVYPQCTLIRGELADLVLYVVREQDTPLVWREAERCAEESRVMYAQTHIS